MNAVLYRWKLAAGREQDFRAAWAEAAERIYRACGSFGSRLHEGADGTFWAYAVWPSEQARLRCFDDADLSSEACFGAMLECVEQRFDEVLLECVDDKLRAEAAPTPPPTLTTARLTLRPLALGDEVGIFPALSDDDNMKWWSSGAHASIDETRDYLAWNRCATGVCTFAITRSENTDDALGWVVLIDRKPAICELGYMLRPDAQGQGIATEAVACAIDYGFSVRELRRVFADTDPENTGSIRLLEKLGFQREGHLRGRWETHIGIRDSLIYGRLASDPAG
jgi:RimJ/RimL family protein N-acetyltransferase